MEDWKALVYKLMVVVIVVADVLLPAAPAVADSHKAGMQAQAGQLILYTHSFYRGDYNIVDLPHGCTELSHSVGSAVNETDESVAFYPDSVCSGVPMIVPERREAPLFAVEPLSYSTYGAI